MNGTCFVHVQSRVVALHVVVASIVSETVLRQRLSDLTITLSSFLLFILTFLKPHFDKAGRPPGKTYIVDPQEVSTLEEIKEKNYIFTDLPNSRGKMKILKFLAKNRLIKNSNRCGNCNGDFHLNAYEQSGDGFRSYNCGLVQFLQRH